MTLEQISKLRSIHDEMRKHIQAEAGEYHYPAINGGTHLLLTLGSPEDYPTSWQTPDGLGVNIPKDRLFFFVNVWVKFTLCGAIRGTQSVPAGSLLEMERNVNQAFACERECDSFEEVIRKYTDLMTIDSLTQHVVRPRNRRLQRQPRRRFNYGEASSVPYRRHRTTV